MICYTFTALKNPEDLQLMKTTSLLLCETLQTLAKGNLVLLEPKSSKDNPDTIRLKANSYVAVMDLMADLISVSRLALDNIDRAESIPEAAASISRLLGIAQELIPYEEADLLDWMRENLG